MDRFTIKNPVFQQIQVYVYSSFQNEVKFSISGVDFSQAMVEQAKQKFKPEIESGKVSLEVADVRELQFDDNTFDKICTVNTIYFWNEPLLSLQEIKRVLKNDGKLVVGI